MFGGNFVSAQIVRHNGFDVDNDGSVFHCVSCHDGVLGKDVGFCIGNCNSGSPHPVLKPYPPLGKERLYAPAALVTAKGIKLYDGKTACISCHDLSNQRKNHLVIDNRGSSLCLSCHLKL